MEAHTPLTPSIRGCGGLVHVAMLGGGEAHRLLIIVIRLVGGERVLGLRLHVWLRGNVWVLPTWGRRECHVERIRRGRRASSHVVYLRGRRSDGVPIDVLV